MLGLEYNIPHGVELGIKKMKKEEICKLCVPPNFAFGDTGNTELGIPPNASLVYEIQLLSFTNVCYGYRTTVETRNFANLLFSFCKELVRKIRSTVLSDFNKLILNSNNTSCFTIHIHLCHFSTYA